MSTSERNKTQGSSGLRRKTFSQRENLRQHRALRKAERTGLDLVRSPLVGSAVRMTRDRSATRGRVSALLAGTLPGASRLWPMPKWWELGYVQSWQESLPHLNWRFEAQPECDPVEARVSSEYRGYCYRVTKLCSRPARSGAFHPPPGIVGARWYRGRRATAGGSRRSALESGKCSTQGRRLAGGAISRIAIRPRPPSSKQTIMRFDAA